MTTRKLLAVLPITCISLCSLAVGWRYGTFSAGDTDPYGYVSQADLIAAGSLHLDVGFSRMLPIPNAASAVVPPGYTLAPDSRSGVPVYSTGLPLVMAAAQLMTGKRDAAFFVVPLLAFVAVWATFAIGSECDDAITGTAAALLLATSPIFLWQSTQPTSDLPAAAFWMAAMAFALRASRLSSLIAGICVSLAILTRPNLVLLALVPGTLLLFRVTEADSRTRRERFTSLVGFVVASAVGCLAVAALNNALHGSPLRSGYGPNSDLFGWRFVLPNLDRYPRWLLETQTPFIFLVFLAPLLARVRFTANIRHLWILSMFAVMNLVSMLFYLAFGPDEWMYLRFILPSIPPLLLLSVVTSRTLLRSATHSRSRLWAPSLLGLLVIALSVWQVREADRRGVFVLRHAERRYVDVGTFIASTAPPDAVYIAGLHSGSIRYYSQRMTINYGRLNEHSLDSAIRALQDKGVPVFIALEEGERQGFTSRFADSDYARLDWPPAHRTYSGVHVNIFDPRDRATFIAGLPVVTGDILFENRPVATTIDGSVR